MNWSSTDGGSGQPGGTFFDEYDADLREVDLVVHDVVVPRRRHRRAVADDAGVANLEGVERMLGQVLVALRLDRERVRRPASAGFSAPRSSWFRIVTSRKLFVSDGARYALLYEARNVWLLQPA